MFRQYDEALREHKVTVAAGLRAYQRFVAAATERNGGWRPSAHTMLKLFRDRVLVEETGYGAAAAESTRSFMRLKLLAAEIGKLRPTTLEGLAAHARVVRSRWPIGPYRETDLQGRSTALLDFLDLVIECGKPDVRQDELDFGAASLNSIVHDAVDRNHS